MPIIISATDSNNIIIAAYAFKPQAYETFDKDAKSGSYATATPNFVTPGKESFIDAVFYISADGWVRAILTDPPINNDAKSLSDYYRLDGRQVWLASATWGGDDILVVENTLTIDSLLNNLINQKVPGTTNVQAIGDFAGYTMEARRALVRMYTWMVSKGFEEREAAIALGDVAVPKVMYDQAYPPRTLVLTLDPDAENAFKYSAVTLLVGNEKRVKHCGVDNDMYRMLDDDIRRTINGIHKTTISHGVGAFTVAIVSPTNDINVEYLDYYTDLTALIEYFHDYYQCVRMYASDKDDVVANYMSALVEP